MSTRMLGMIAWLDDLQVEPVRYLAAGEVGETCATIARTSDRAAASELPRSGCRSAALSR